MEEVIYLLHITDKSHLAILKDKNVTKHILTKLVFGEYIYLELESDTSDKIKSYIVLKYGDNIKPINSIVRDFSPIMHVDYTIKISQEHKHLLEKS